MPDLGGRRDSHASTFDVAPRMMAVLSGTAVLVVQLLATDVSIALAPDSVVVDARFRIATVKEARASVARLQGQEVVFLIAGDVEQGGAPDAPYGLQWVHARAADSGSGTFRLSYVVRGALERIPIAVPEWPAVAGAASVTLRITGSVDDIDPGDGFPRLMRRVDGSLVAQLDNVPSFVRLARASDRWSMNRMTEGLVVVLVVLASAGWWARTRRHQGRPA